MSYLNNEDLLHEIQFGGRSGGHPSREDEFEDINRLFPTIEYVESLKFRTLAGHLLESSRLINIRLL